MKIYFAGSIRGGRADLEIYARIIDRLKRFGNVLTEHVADPGLLDLEGLSPDELIYHRDMYWLEQADVLIAEVTNPSLGVGYEIGSAQAMGKRILYLYREQEGKRLSAMISGNKSLMVKHYEHVEEALDHIDKFFATVITEL